MNASREFEFWTPDPTLFAGAALVFCLASGPSLTREVCDKIRGRGRAVVVNSSHTLAPWADVLFFTDSGWYEPRRAVVAEWPGLVVSMSRTAKRELPDKVLRVQGFGDPDLPVEFPTLGSPVIRQGRSSGHTAISLAIALGARKIALLGYDMRLVGGREHHHDEYRNPRDREVYARDFLPGFRGWNELALKAGVTIVNATPDSAITEFPSVDLDQVLLDHVLHAYPV